MKIDKRFTALWLGFVFAAASLSSERLDAAPGQAIVRGITGQALLSKGGNPSELLAVGSKVSSGDVVKTGVGSALDLYVGENVGTIRLTQDTILRLKTLDVSEDHSNQVTEAQLILEAGTILGQGGKPGFGVTNQVQVSNGVAAIGNGLYRINARGYTVLLDGSLIFAHIASNGEIKAHELKAPPPAYFSPVEGIREAPPALVKEIQKQWKAKLKARAKDAR